MEEVLMLGFWNLGRWCKRFFFVLTIPQDERQPEEKGILQPRTASTTPQADTHLCKVKYYQKIQNLCVQFPFSVNFQYLRLILED